MTMKSKLANGQPTGYTPPSTPPHSCSQIIPRNFPKLPTRTRRSIGFGNLINEKLQSHERRKQDVRLLRKNSSAVVNTKGTVPKPDLHSDESPTTLLDTLIRSISIAGVPEGINTQVWGDESELQSLRNMAAEELCVRPKFGETYKAVTVDVERIKKRLKDLSILNGDEGKTTNYKTTVDEGLEISDAVSLLKLKRCSYSEIEMAGQKAQRAATLMLQAQIMSNKANELLAQSKQILKSANL